MDLPNGSVAQNIARMKIKSSPEMVVEAAKNAGAHEIIGHKTDIGIGGSNLFGGQRQRVTLVSFFV